MQLGLVAFDQHDIVAAAVHDAFARWRVGVSKASTVMTRPSTTSSRNTSSMTGISLVLSATACCH